MKRFLRSSPCPICGNHAPYLSRYEVRDGLIKLAGCLSRGNLWATYSGQEVVTDYSHMRTWIGHQLLAPSDYSEGCFDIVERRVDGNRYFLPPAAVSVLELPATASERTE